MRVACLCPTEFFDYSSIVEDIVQDRTGQDVEFVRFKPHDGDVPGSLDWDAVVVTGSEYHVYDRQPWVEESQVFLRSVLAADVPVLGICYGHQLLADALGGTVTDMDEREMGYREVRLTEAGRESPLFEGMDERFVSFCSHLDHVAEAPDTTTVLAENEYGTHAFRSELFPAWGIQFHPEYSREMAEELLEEKEMSREEVESVRLTFTDENVAAARSSRMVFDRFLEML